MLNVEYIHFLDDIKKQIRQSQYKAVRAVNAELITLYYNIGKEILKRQEEQGWGAKTIERLSGDLTEAFPDMKGFSSRNLKYMRKFAEEYPDSQIVQEALAQLTWYHNITLIEKIKDKEAREFYIKKAVENGWSRAVMVHQIELKLHERQGKALNNFDEQLPTLQSDLAKQTFKDPYIFDFLNLSQEASERDLEKALISRVEKFLLELGEGFAFLGRQYHLQIENEDYYLDLLFYHIRLRCYIVIELKVDQLKPAHFGQMNYYLSAVDDLLKQPSDNPTIGLILCKSKEGVKVEYAMRDLNKPIGLAEYQLLPEKLKTSLPSIEELERELSLRVKEER